MPMYFVRQPDGLLARYSTVVDNFCEVNMTEADALKWGLGQPMSEQEAAEKVRGAVGDEVIGGERRWCVEPLHRWYDSLVTTLTCGGTDELARFLDRWRAANGKRMLL